MGQVGQIGIEVDQVTPVAHVIIFKTIAVLETIRIRHRAWVNMSYRHASVSTSLRPSLAVLSKLVPGVEMMA